MKVKDILREAIVTQHLLYNPNDDRGPYNMSDPSGPYDMTADEQEEDGKEPALATCGNCSGTGEGMYPGSKCRVCKGEGVIDNRERDDSGPWDDYDDGEGGSWANRNH